MERSTAGYAVLRDRRKWDAERAGLRVGEEGALTLARVPGPGDARPIVHPVPYETPASGVAVGRCRDLYVADTANHTVLWILDGCREKRYRIGNGAGSQPGEFDTPRGLAVGPQDLFVADSGNDRIQVFRLPNLDLRGIWEDGLDEPTCVACDGQGRLYVLHNGLKRIRRFDASGVPDPAYDDAMSQHAELIAPVWIAIGSDDVLYVSDNQSNDVLRFDSDGVALDPLPKAGAPQWPRAPEWPRAVAAHHDQLYVADAKTGRIYVRDAGQGWLGTLPGYSGPVAAMALDETGVLYVKHGLDEAYDELRAYTSHVSEGKLTAGPFDAGERTEWARVNVDVDQPPGTTVSVRLHTSRSRTNAPSDADWDLDKALASSLDTLVPPLPGLAPYDPSDKRYLWIRVELRTTDPYETPRLRQVSAQTPAESYLDYLPAVYRREDAGRQFLARWLAFFQAQLGDLEWALDELPRRFDPATVAESDLPALSRWLGFDLPPDKDPEEWREILLRVPALYERRGIPAGLRDLAEIYTGTRPHLFEAFRERRVWQLGTSSLLGFDTALAASAPDGMVVPGFVRADPALMGLRGDYYEGTNFERLRYVHVDPAVDFEWNGKAPVEDVMPTDMFSVRWTGQLQPEHSEIYTFHTRSDDGVRLWVGGRLIIDNWTDHAPTDNSGRIALTGGRWYPITLEYYEKRGAATIKLSWSSRSQPKEIVPQERLYAVHDEGARLAEGTPLEAQAAGMVGQVVVGDTGPLAASDLGAPLFSDTAYVFTAVVPAGQVADPVRRERLTDLIEAEKPAHTDFHLCFVEPRMRVGLQARVGVDSIVAGPRPPLDLHGSMLDVDSYLGDDHAGSFGRLGQRGHLGQDTIVG